LTHVPFYRGIAASCSLVTVYRGYRDIPAVRPTMSLLTTLHPTLTVRCYFTACSCDFTSCH